MRLFSCLECVQGTPSTTVVHVTTTANMVHHSATTRTKKRRRPTAPKTMTTFCSIGICSMASSTVGSLAASSARACRSACSVLARSCFAIRRSPSQDSTLQLGIVSSYASRGGIRVCSRPLWGPISAGYQGIIGGRAAKRQFTPRTEDRALPHGPPRYHSNSLRFRRTRAPLAPSSPSALLSGALASLLCDAHSSALQTLSPTDISNLRGAADERRPTRVASGSILDSRARRYGVFTCVSRNIHDSLADVPRSHH